MHANPVALNACGPKRLAHRTKSVHVLCVPHRKHVVILQVSWPVLQLYSFLAEEDLRHFFHSPPTRKSGCVSEIPPTGQG